MGNNKSELTTIVEYPYLEINEWKRIYVRKVMKGNIPCIDIRLHQRYPFSEEFYRTSKGIFLDEKQAMEMLMPYLIRTLNIQTEQTNEVPMKHAI